ncbi:unnamed protein product [Penicillium pancosmium]
MALIGRELLVGRTLSSVISSTATPTVTTAPAITACSLVNQDATTFNDPLGSVVSLSSTIACACNNDWTAGVGTTVGDDKSITYTCQVGTSTTIAVSTAAPSASPIPSQCANGANPDESCFNALDLPDFIMDWWKDNEANCGDYDGFADCWYAKMTPYSPSKCDQLNTDPACTQPLWKDFTGFNDVQRFYVTWCIWNTQGFFLDMYNAVGNAAQPVSDAIGSIVTTLDPPDDSTSPWEYVFMALTFGLSLYSEGSVLVKAFLRSAPQTSTVLHNVMFPAGDVSGDVTAWADVADELGKFTTKWQKSIGTGLPLVQNNISVFIPLHQNTPLSGVRPSLDDLTSTIQQSVGGYVASACLNELNWVVTRAEKIDVRSLQNAGNLQWDTGCDSDYDGNGICDSYFYDGTDTYSITDPQNMATDQDKIMQKLIGGESPFTTGKILFTSGLQCTQTCGANGGCAPSLDPNDPSSASCISTARVCTWTWDDYGPFQPGCANLPSSDAVLPRFGVDPCVGHDMSTSVPWSYLGGGIVDNNAPGWWADQVVCHTKY